MHRAYYAPIDCFVITFRASLSVGRRLQPTTGSCRSQITPGLVMIAHAMRAILAAIATVTLLTCILLCSASSEWPIRSVSG